MARGIARQATRQAKKDAKKAAKKSGKTPEKAPREEDERMMDDDTAAVTSPVVTASGQRRRATPKNDIAKLLEASPQIRKLAQRRAISNKKARRVGQQLRREQADKVSAAQVMADSMEGVSFKRARTVVKPPAPASVPARKTASAAGKSRAMTTRRTRRMDID